MSEASKSVAKVTLITGGASGIGATVVRQLLSHGHRVAVTGRDEARLARFAETLSVRESLLTIAADPSSYEDMARAVGLAVGRFGRLDHVVANAGFSTHDNIVTGDPERWKEMLMVNVLGPLVLAKAALPHLKETRGRVVLLGSIAGIKNTPGNVYSVTKWAVSALAENLRQLVTGDGIGVTLVSPGRADTPFYDGPGGATKNAKAGPMLTPENVAETILWALEQPAGVDINAIVVRPVGQAN